MSLVNPKGLQHFSDANGLAAARWGSRRVDKRKTELQRNSCRLDSPMGATARSPEP
jgi:hypothetical protein